MMNIEEIMALEPKEIVEKLKEGRLTAIPNLKEVQKQIDVTKHTIFDEAERPDKIIKNDDGSSRKEKVARIGLALQKLIVKRAVAFIFGNPVKYLNSNNNSEDAYNEFLSLLKKVKIDSFNRKIARDLFTCTEVAELWYPVPVKATDTTEEKFKLKVKKLSILTGDTLYPYFDEYGDMVAFSREYKVGEDTFFEVYTATQIHKFIKSEEVELVEGFPVENVFGKIPIVYAKQEESAYHDVTDLIERLEKLLSNFADTNDYHGAPKLFVKGTIKGFSKKGESGAIIEGDASTSAEYLSWQHAPESVKVEIATLKEMIHTISQTPDISFDSIKGLGGNAVSGKALKFMFLDAHLKVMDNLEVLGEYLERRTSIIKAFMMKADTKLKTAIEELEIEAVVVPFMLDDNSDQLEFVMTATGNKPVLSQKSGIKLAGLVDDVDKEYNELKKDEATSLFEPTE